MPAKHDASAGGGSVFAMAAFVAVPNVLLPIVWDAAGNSPPSCAATGSAMAAVAVASAAIGGLVARVFGIARDYRDRIEAYLDKQAPAGVNLFATDSAAIPGTGPKCGNTRYDRQVEGALRELLDGALRVGFEPNLLLAAQPLRPAAPGAVPWRRRFLRPP